MGIILRKIGLVDKVLRLELVQKPYGWWDVDKVVLVKLSLKSFGGEKVGRVSLLKLA